MGPEWLEHSTYGLRVRVILCLPLLINVVTIYTNQQLIINFTHKPPDLLLINIRLFMLNLPTDRLHIAEYS